MAKGKTLWEMFLERFEEPVENQVYNPLKAKIGSGFTINTLELKDLNFFLREIREYRRTIGGKLFPFVDYVLLARQLGGEDIWVRLRLNPVDDPTRVAGVTHHALLLRLFDEMPYSEDFHRVVNDATRKFEVMENGQVTEEYWRIHDVSTPYKARVAVVQDTDQDGRAEKSEVERFPLEYWDYWREVQDAAGQPVTQYLFVEMNATNGWFQIWKGEELDPQKVLVI